MVQPVARRRSRRPRPNIDWTFFSGNTDTAPPATVFTLTPVAELAPLSDQLHFEEVQVFGIYECVGTNSLGLMSVALFPQKTGATVNFEDAGVRVRMIQGNTAGIPFFLRFKNINLKAGEALRLEGITQAEHTSTNSHTVIGGFKLVFRELR